MCKLLSWQLAAESINSVQNKSYDSGMQMINIGKPFFTSS